MEPWNHIQVRGETHGPTLGCCSVWPMSDRRRRGPLRVAWLSWCRWRSWRCRHCGHRRGRRLHRRGCRRRWGRHGWRRRRRAGHLRDHPWLRCQRPRGSCLHRPCHGCRLKLLRNPIWVRCWHGWLTGYGLTSTQKGVCDPTAQSCWCCGHCSRRR